MKTIVFSLGGSLIVPDDIDVLFLKEFVSFVRKHLKNTKFIIVTGGGKTCRRYIEAAKQLGVNDQEALDWIGIAATRLNQQFIKEIFGNNAKISLDHTKKISGWKMLVGAGIRPGYSTDYDSVLLAKTYNADYVINLTDVKYVYTADPKKDPDAKPLKKLSWKEYKKIIGRKWISGMHTPFDPIASQIAEKSGIKVVILNAKSIGNLDNFLKGKAFIGSVIE